jgi:hypothetical protein
MEGQVMGPRPGRGSNILRADGDLVMCVGVFEDKSFGRKERSFFSTAHVGGYTIDDSRGLIGMTGKLGAIVVALREDGGGESGRFL